MAAGYRVRMLPAPPVAKLETRKPERCGDTGCVPCDCV